MATANPTRTPSGFLTFVAGLAGLVIFAVLVVWWTKAKGPADNMESKRAQSRYATRDQIAKRDAERLSQVGWVDKSKGVAHVPINDAMKLTLAELKGKKPTASQVKVEPPPPPAPVPDPASTEPPPLAMVSAPAGAQMTSFAFRATPAPVALPASAAAIPPATIPAPATATPPPPATPAATPMPAIPATPAPQSTPTPPQPVPVPAITDAAPPAPSGDLYAAGKMQYMMLCVACHQPTGMGLPMVFPPLVKSEYVTGDPKRFAAMILKGVAGPITIEGKLYNSIMPPQETLLDDTKIAAVTTYVRKEFGPGAAPISPDLVAQVRKEIADKKTPYTEAELKAFGGDAPPAAPSPAAHPAPSDNAPVPPPPSAPVPALPVPPTPTPEAQVAPPTPGVPAPTPPTPNPTPVPPAPPITPPAPQPPPAAPVP